MLERIAIALILNRDLGVSVVRGLELADAILQSSALPVPVGTLGGLSFDVRGLRQTLERSIDDALEGVAPPTRGRPDGQKIKKRGALLRRPAGLARCLGSAN